MNLGSSGWMARIGRQTTETVSSNIPLYPSKRRMLIKCSTLLRYCCHSVRVLFIVTVPDCCNIKPQGIWCREASQRSTTNFVRPHTKKPKWFCWCKWNMAVRWIIMVAWHSLAQSLAGRWGRIVCLVTWQGRLLVFSHEPLPHWHLLLALLASGNWCFFALWLAGN